MSKSLSFPRSRRLRLRAEFQRVRHEGESLRGNVIVINYLKKAEPGVARVGIVTPKRVGHAVVRNRTRRRLREIWRKHQENIAGGVWLVIVASNGAAEASCPTLEDEWLRLARRASILAR